jgi:hypothetical protein
MPEGDDLPCGRHLAYGNVCTHSLPLFIIIIIQPTAKLLQAVVTVSPHPTLSNIISKMRNYSRMFGMTGGTKIAFLHLLGPPE